MKVAVFTDTYLPTIDGVVNSIRNSRRVLESLGHEVLVIAPGDGKSAEGEGGRTLYCRSRELKRYPGYRLAIYPTRKEQEFLRDTGAELIHSHGIAFMGLKGLWAARELGLPMALTFHTMVQEAVPHYMRWGSHVFQRLLHTYLRVFLHRCGAVITPTKGVLAELWSLAPRMRKTAVVPNGVDVERFRPGLRGETIRERYGFWDAEVVLHVGRMSPEKGIRTLIDALPYLLVERPHLRLVLAGTGPALETYRGYALRKGMGGAVVFTGFVPDEELPLYYATADVMATGSAFETQGLAALEAMACGVPVAAANSRAFPEYIEDGVNGFLFPPGDPQECAASVLRALDAKEGIRRRARRTAEDFSLERCTKRLLDLYEEMLA